MTETSDPAFEAVTYTISQKRLRRLASSGMRRSFSLQYWFCIAWLAGFIVVMGLFSAFADLLIRWVQPLTAAYGFKGDWVVIVIFVLLSGIFLGGIFWQRQFMKKEIERRVNPENTATMKLIDGGISIGADTIEHRVKWAGIDRLLLEPDGLALAHGTLFLFVPSSAFSSMAVFEAFRDYIIDNLTPAARARSLKEIKLANKI